MKSTIDTEIIKILKRKPMLLSAKEILTLADKNGDLHKMSLQSLAHYLKKMYEDKKIGMVKIQSRNRYCELHLQKTLAEEKKETDTKRGVALNTVLDTAINSDEKGIALFEKENLLNGNPEIKRINTKIGIMSGLIVVVFIGFILFVSGLSLAGGWDGYGDFTLGGIGMFVFFGANIALGFLAGPFSKFIKGFNDWVDDNQPGAGASCSDSMVGCGNVGCGYFVVIPLCGVFGIIGFVFGIIAIKKLIEKKKNLK